MGPPIANGLGMGSHYLRTDRSSLSIILVWDYAFEEEWHHVSEEAPGFI